MVAMKNPFLSGWHCRGYLPHWKQEGGIYSVTFRLAGTLPQTVLKQIKREREEHQRRLASMAGTLQPADIHGLDKLFSRKIDEYLGAGYGECWLRQREIANILKVALCYFDRTRYLLHAWVIMPNHAHILVAPLGGHVLSKILHSWKSYSSNKANEILGRPGQPFWQHESYDHLVRDKEEYWECIDYLCDNPVKAGLCRRPFDWPFLYVFGLDELGTPVPADGQV